MECIVPYKTTLLEQLIRLVGQRLPKMSTVPGLIPTQRCFYAVRIHACPVCFDLSLAHVEDPSTLPN